MNTLISNRFLGKKRNFEVTKKSSSHLPIIHSSKLFPGKSNNNMRELFHLYNMGRSIFMSCVKTKNKKYDTNKFIPCVHPFLPSS